jgi:hypothetical protein
MRLLTAICISNDEPNSFENFIIIIIFLIFLSPNSVGYEWSLYAVDSLILFSLCPRKKGNKVSQLGLSGGGRDVET